MKKFKFVLFIAIFLLTGCSTKENNELNVLNWSSYIPQSVINMFEEETGVKVNYSTYSSNEELLAKVSNVKKGTYDLVFPSDYMVEIMISKNLLQKIDKSKIYNLRNLNKEYMNLYFDKGNKYTLPFISTSTLISVNSKCINNKITSYNDLLNPEYKNNIVLVDDQRIIIGMGLLANGYNMNSNNPYEINKAYEWLEKLKPNIKAYDSDSPKNFLITEEACLGVVWNAEGALASFENPNIVNVYPSEGSALSLDNFAILKGSNNVDNAYKFIEYILKPSVMKEIIESYPYKSVNVETDKMLDNSFIINNAVNIPSNVIANSYFVKNVGTDIKLYDQVWMKLK